MMISFLYLPLAIGYGQVVVVFLFFLIPLLLLIRAIIRWLNRH